MNEIQLILRQLSAESERARAVVQACAADPAGAGPQFRETSVEYLSCVLAWFEERDRRLGELYARRPADDPDRRSVERTLDDAGSSREALERLERVGGREGWQDLASFVAGPWTGRREAIGRVLAANARVVDWRLVGGIDADSILEERRRYARFRQHLPPGTAVPTGP